jgi:hypothetical protein
VRGRAQVRSSLLIIHSQLFRSIHPPNTIESHLAPENLKGSIDPKEAAKV